MGTRCEAKESLSKQYQSTQMTESPKATCQMLSETNWGRGSDGRAVWGRSECGKARARR